MCTYTGLLFYITLYQRCVVRKVPENSQTRKFAGLQNLLDLRTFHICGNFRFADPIFFVICGFLCVLQASENPEKHHFSPYKYRLRMLWFTVLYEKFLQNTLRPIVIWYCHTTADKGPNFLKKVFQPLCLVVKNMRIFDLRINHKTWVGLWFAGPPKKFADSRLRNEPKNMRIRIWRTFKISKEQAIKLWVWFFFHQKSNKKL